MQKQNFSREDLLNLIIQIQQLQIRRECIGDYDKEWEVFSEVVQMLSDMLEEKYE